MILVAWASACGFPKVLAALAVSTPSQKIAQAEQATE
jgi:hypothetical protein